MACPAEDTKIVSLAPGQKLGVRGVVAVIGRDGRRAHAPQVEGLPCPRYQARPGRRAEGAAGSIHSRPGPVGAVRARGEGTGLADQRLERAMAIKMVVGWRIQHRHHRPAPTTSSSPRTRITVADAPSAPARARSGRGAGYRTQGVETGVGGARGLPRSTGARPVCSPATLGSRARRAPEARRGPPPSRRSPDVSPPQAGVFPGHRTAYTP